MKDNDLYGGLTRLHVVHLTNEKLIETKANIMVLSY